MNLGAPRILVVDDREDEGLQIAKALWADGLAVQFVHHDPAQLLKRKSKLRGVRIVFMDINLSSGPMGSEAQNFAIVETVLRTLLAEDNGPYVLISWTSHDDVADALFAHLNVRLPESLRPVLTKRLRKEDYQSANQRKLPRTIGQLLKDTGFAGCLMEWEAVIRGAAVSTLHTVSALASELTDNINHPNSNAKLGAVIRALARAEAVDHLNNESAFPALSTVLSQLLTDHATMGALRAAKTFGALILSGSNATEPADWSQRVHRALHVEYGGPKRTHAPGDAFEYPRATKRKRAGLPKLDPIAFVPQQFLIPDKWDRLSEAQRTSLIADCRLILVEITPPCDHANIAKLVWHRYVVGLEVGLQHQKLLLGKAEYLQRLAPFLAPDNGARVVVLNARATVSVPPTDANALGKRLYRLKPAILSDLIRWVSAQNARLGYTRLD